LPLRRTTAIAAGALLALCACSSDDDDGGAADGDEETTSTTEAVEPLTILVTNDDGIGAVGIDVLVNALLEMEGVEVEIVAPAANQSGSADKTTPGGAPYAAGATASGVEGTAVEGFPADTIAVALDELGLDPDLVVSGVNTGQNVGPLAYVSGTVGAGRAAVRRGIPAIAGSAGLTEDTLDDYELATELIIDNIEEHRAEYAAAAASGDVEAVVNINVPDCTAGSPKELLEVALATEIPEGVDPFATDCSAVSGETPADDVLAIAAGYPALSLVSPEAPTP
jgi:5'-nucleotidase